MSVLPFHVGSIEVAKAIRGINPIRGHAQMGDSLSTNVANLGGSPGVGIHVGIAKKWLPKQGWGGMFIPANASGSNITHSYSIFGGQPWTPYTIDPSESVYDGGGTALGNGLTEGMHPCPLTKVTFSADAPSGGSAVGQFYLSGIAAAYGVGDWCVGRTLTARFIHIAYADQAPLRARTLRPTPGGFVTENASYLVNPGPGTPILDWTDVTLGTSANSDPEGRIMASDGNENGRSFYTLGVHIFDPSNPGYELVTMGIGGSSPLDHTRAGGEKFKYTDTALQRMFLACNVEAVTINISQNLGDLSTQISADNSDGLRDALLDIIDRCADALVANGKAPYIRVKLHHKTGYTDPQMETKWRGIKEAVLAYGGLTDGYSLFHRMGDTTADVIDGVHLNYNGCLRAAEVEWNDTAIILAALGGGSEVTKHRLLKMGVI